MRYAVLAGLSLVLAMPATQPARARIPRAALVPLEGSFDTSIAKSGQQDSFDLLGNTRAVYLSGYGVVFTAEVNLIVTPPITPFRPVIAKEDVERIHQRKLAKLEVLKKAMRDLMATSAGSLGALPANEQIVVSVTLFYFSWEQKEGLPSQILMQASKGALVKGGAPGVEEF